MAYTRFSPLGAKNQDATHKATMTARPMKMEYLSASYVSFHRCRAAKAEHHESYPCAMLMSSSRFARVFSNADQPVQAEGCEGSLRRRRRVW